VAAARFQRACGLCGTLKRAATGISVIRFRCWYCNKRHAVDDERIGELRTCTCERRIRVPKRNGGPCRVRTPIDYLVEGIVYGGGGALLGLGLGLLIVASVWRFWYRDMWGALILVPVLTLVGFCVGLFGGEAGVNWIGRMIRDQEDNW
jgi:hypothetical protein